MLFFSFSCMIFISFLIYYFFSYYHDRHTNTFWTALYYGFSEIFICLLIGPDLPRLLFIISMLYVESARCVCWFSLRPQWCQDERVLHQQQKWIRSLYIMHKMHHPDNDRTLVLFVKQTTRHCRWQTPRRRRKKGSGKFVRINITNINVIAIYI